jgi:hypothetical protein
LHTIIFREIRGSDIPVSEADVEARLQPLIQAATKILKKHEGDENGKKWVRVWHKTSYYPSWTGMGDMLWTKDIEIEP